MLFDPQIRHWEKENIPSPTEYHRLIKIPLLTALEQTAKLGKTMNIINTKDFPT